MRIFKNFIIKHTYIALFFSILILVFCIVIAYVKFPSTIEIEHITIEEFLILFVTLSSFLTIFSIPCYKFGKTRWVISTTWNIIERKYGNTKEAQEKYKEHNLRIASILFPMSILAFIVYIIIINN